MGSILMAFKAGLQRAIREQKEYIFLNRFAHQGARAAKEFYHVRRQSSPQKR